MRLHLAALALLLPLTACGGDDAATDDTSSYDSGQAVADDLGCDNYDGDMDQQFVADGGSCELGGATVYVHHFSDDTNRDQWLEIATQFELTSDRAFFLSGADWVVQGPEDVLMDAQADLGGEISTYEG